MSTTTTSTCRPPKNAGLAPRSISARTSAAQVFPSTIPSRSPRFRRKRRGAEPCRRPSRALAPPLASSSLPPPLPSPDPAFEVESSTSTCDTPSRSSASGKAASYSTLPTDVGSTCQGSTLILSATSPARHPRPADHAPSKVQVIYPLSEPEKDWIWPSGVGGMQRQSPPAQPTSPSRTSPPVVTTRPSLGAKLPYAALPSPFPGHPRIPATKSPVIPIPQNQHMCPSGPIDIVPCPRRRDHYAGVPSQGPGLPSRIQKSTTAMQPTTAHLLPPHRFLPSHTRPGAVATVPPRQPNKSVSHKITESDSKPPASGVDLAVLVKKPVDLPTVVQKPPPSPQKAPKYTFIPRWFSRSPRTMRLLGSSWL